MERIGETTCLLTPLEKELLQVEAQLIDISDIPIFDAMTRFNNDLATLQDMKSQDDKLLHAERAELGIELAKLAARKMMLNSIAYQVAKDARIDMSDATPSDFTG